MANRFEATDMNKHTDSSLRTLVEKIFAGLAATLTVTVISAGTLAMCFPGFGVV
jgi:hypothetical protein